MLNRVVLVGRLTREPELKFTQSGKAVANFTLAVDRQFQKNETDFIDIVVWGTPAENCAKYLTKGSTAAVDGKLKIRSYETNDGQKRKIAEVIADNVRFLSGQSGQAKPPEHEQIFEQADLTDDDLPF